MAFQQKQQQQQHDDDDDNAGNCQNKKLIAVAYNPYFPSTTERHQERERLEQKKIANWFGFGCIYLQFGTNLDLLTNIYALDVLQTYNNNNNNKITIIASIFLPTAQLIAQQRCVLVG